MGEVEGAGCPHLLRKLHAADARVIQRLALGRHLRPGPRSGQHRLRGLCPVPAPAPRGLADARPSLKHFHRRRCRMASNSTALAQETIESEHDSHFSVVSQGEERRLPAQIKVSHLADLVLMSVHKRVQGRSASDPTTLKKGRGPKEGSNSAHQVAGDGSGASLSHIMLEMNQAEVAQTSTGAACGIFMRIRLQLMRRGGGGGGGTL